MSESARQQARDDSGVEALAGDREGQIIHGDSLPDPAEALATKTVSDGRRSVAGGRSADWQEIIWREWRHTVDKPYAQHLFELVANQTAGRAATVVPLLISSLYGILTGLLVGLLISVIASLNEFATQETPFSFLPPLLGLIGGIAGGATWFWLQPQRFSWRTWLKRLTPNVAIDKFGGSLSWLGQRLLFGLNLGLTAAVVGLFFELVIRQGITGLVGLTGLLVSMLGLGIVFGLSIGREDGLILGLGGWLGSWLAIGIVFWLAGWQAVGLVSLSLGILGVLAGFLGVLVAGWIVGIGIRSGLDIFPDYVRDLGPALGRGSNLTFVLVGFLGIAVVVLDGLTSGQRSLLWLIDLWLGGPVNPQGLDGLGGVLGWLGTGVGIGLGVLFGALRLGLDDDYKNQYRPWFFWWRERPQAYEVREAIKQACQTQPAARKIWAAVIDQLEQSQKEPGSTKTLMTQFQSQDWTERFIAGHTLVALGGEAIASLRSVALDKRSPLRQTSIWLLHSIGRETTSRLAPQAARLLCPHCLIRCGIGSVQLPDGNDFTYYGCRACGQSREFWECPAGVVARLDAGWTETHNLQDGLLRVNWLTRRTLFDFDAVEIIQATDEDVERFAVQVGNDTDPFRRPHYKQMRCIVMPGCELSENTLRILRRTFGEVELMR